MSRRNKPKRARPTPQPNQPTALSQKIGEVYPELTQAPPLFQIPNQQTQVRVETVRHEGPLPPPALLDGYEKVVPGAAERIIQLAEKEQEHRQALEKAAIQSDVDVKASFQTSEKFRLESIFKSDRRGQYLGAFVSTIALAGAIACALNGVSWQVSIALVGLPVLGMVNALTSTLSRSKHHTDTEVEKNNPK